MGVTGQAQVFGASAIAGFFASFFSLPFDFVKSIMQSQKPDPTTGRLKYSSSLNCAMTIMKESGPLRFYAGFPTFYVRIAPHAMITLIAQDNRMRGPRARSTWRVKETATSRSDEAGIELAGLPQLSWKSKAAPQNQIFAILHRECSR